MYAVCVCVPMHVKVYKINVCMFVERFFYRKGEGGIPLPKPLFGVCTCVIGVSHAMCLCTFVIVMLIMS